MEASNHTSTKEHAYILWRVSTLYGYRYNMLAPPTTTSAPNCTSITNDIHDSPEGLANQTLFNFAIHNLTCGLC